MSIIVKQAQKEIIRLEKMIKIIDEFQKNEPQGCLKCQNKGGKIFFCHQYMDKDVQKMNYKFIRKNNSSLARKLAQKQYYSFLKPIIKRNLKTLKNLVEQYDPEGMVTIYDNLSEVRKTLIEPIKGSREEMIQSWYEENYEVNTSYPESLRYETEQGELVRSKSEVIIANILYQHRDDLLYKYECPLKVIVAGKEMTIYPDFKILNSHTGKITYWEHAGLMDDADYANDFVRKVNTYANNDLLLGRDVVLSYETQENPLDINVIKKIVEELKG